MKTAFVLGGGGSKGAYEIGVWKALKELNIHFDIVTGTSIGAMIGAMIVQDDYEKCLKLWEEITVDQVMKDGVNLDFDIELIMSQKDQYKTFLSSMFENKGADISPFCAMIDEMFDEGKFFSSPIDYACMCVNLSKLQHVGKRKADMKDGAEAKDFILASASCFPAFPMKKIADDYYIDGGYYDNVPIELAKEMGAEQIIAVDLKAIGRNKVKESEKNLIYIEPWISLGSFLMFDQQLIDRNMKLGYFDTMKKFNQYLGTIYTFDKKEKKTILEEETMMKEFLNTFTIEASKERLTEIYQKIMTHQIQEEVQKITDFPFGFLHLLEEGAYLFDVDFLKVYTMKSFKAVVKETLNNYCPSYEKEISELSFKDSLGKIKTFSKKDLIYYIYSKLCNPGIDKNTLFDTFIAIFTEEFLIAYMLFLC